MAKYISKGKLTHEGENEIKRLATNFNAKLKKVEKKHPDIAHLQPEKINVNELINLIEDYSDFKNAVKMLTAYTEKGAEKAVQPVVNGEKQNYFVSSFHNEEMQRHLKAENAKRANERKQAKNDIESGQLTFKQIQEAYEVKEQTKPINLQAKNYKSFMSFYDTVTSQFSPKGQRERDSQSLEYWQKAISSTFMNEEQKENLLKELNRIGIKKLRQKYYTGVLSAQIDFVYDESHSINYKYEQIMKLFESL